MTGSKCVAWKIIAALVLLRLIVGWHFFSEGTKKLAYNEGTGQWRLNFSADSFFSQAQGPLAGLFKSQVPGVHDWQNLLAVPKQSVPLPEAEQYKRADWAKKYEERRAEAKKGNQPLPVEFPESASYYQWATRIVKDWTAKLKAFTDLPGLTKEQRAQSANRFQVRHQALADYLADETEAIEDYQHDLWRLGREQARRGADAIPYQEQRVAKKQAEVARAANPWVAEVRDFEQGLIDDLQGIVNESEIDNTSLAEGAESVFENPKQKRMRWLSLAVTCMVTSVGVCLLLGFFTRLASCVGALFLLSVIVTQPPWLADSLPTMFQAVEMAALLVLAATAAGRWAGLDFFTHAFCQKFCHK